MPVKATMLEVADALRDCTVDGAFCLSGTPGKEPLQKLASTFERCANGFRPMLD